jgi:signal transduction histidine kinase
MAVMTFDDIAALAFQTLCTLALAAVHLGLWRQRRLPYHATWAAAWFVYALRLTFIAAFMRQQRELGWLFAHQVVTLWSGLLLLWAALQFAAHVRWRTWMLAVPLLAVAWAWYGVFVIHSMATAGLSSALLLSAVTFGTGFVFLRLDRHEPSVGARLLAWGFLLWGVHHLDYPLLRAQGSGVLIGVFMDVTLLILVAVGTLVLVLGEERRTLAQRTVQLEQLSALLLRAQEEERRRIARELHDEAGQTLTALKIELDLEGRREASTRVALVLNQIRNVSELLRPRALDDLGLVPALRALIEDFARRTQIQVEIDADDTVGWPPEAALTLYRVVQESLTNVARHSGARHAWVRLTRNDHACRLVVEDDGTGLPSALTPHLGVLGMRERVGAAGGTLQLVTAGRGGLRVEATVPTGGGA